MEQWKEIASLAGKLTVVTDANSGIGWHTALELARAGSEVVLTARNEAKGQEAVDRIRRQISQANVRLGLLDLASLGSVRAFAVSINHAAKLNLFANNAGDWDVKCGNHGAGRDGIEPPVF